MARPLRLEHAGAWDHLTARSPEQRRIFGYRRRDRQPLRRKALGVFNQFTNATRSGTLTVAGTFAGSPTNLTVNGLSAERYADSTFASSEHTLADGTNTFTAIAQDTLRLGAASSPAISMVPSVWR